MNDRFKFRVWSEEDCGYMESIDIFRLTHSGKLVFNNDSLNREPECNPKRYICEQCTGLKDKNGKLIYEGDILKPNGNTITKEVVYEDGSCWAKDTIYFHDKCHIFQRWIDECGYEIVGNIHEKESK